MIVEWFLGLVETVSGWFFQLFEGWNLPTFVMSPPADIYQVFVVVDSMGVWVPWGSFSIVFSLVVGAYIVLFIVKLVKQLIAHVPGFGGSG